MRSPDAAARPEYEDRLQRFQNLMPRRVRRLLLVASRYDEFLLAEDGQLNELILSESFDPTLRDRPWMTRISNGAEALAALSDKRHRFDLVVATLHLRDMDVLEFARLARQQRPRVPIVVLAFDSLELAAIRARGDLRDVERLFVWQGDFRILLGIVKSLEDRWNVARDTRRVGVSSIILIEDSVRYYSAFLPVIYEELLKQSRRVIAEGMNLTNKVMRMRARPKILHCVSYEEAIAYFEKYRGTLLGIISDVDFPRAGQPHAASGLDFARMVRERAPDLPIMLQTRDPGYAARAREAGITLLLKDSPFLLEELSSFIRNSFGFGDFVFREPDGREVARAKDLGELEALLHSIPDSSLLFHAERQHFSTWLRARTEFSLAETLRPRRVSEFASLGEIRRYLVDSVREFRRERQSGVISFFEAETFECETSFAKIGGGSIGGKARGLAFVRQLLYENRLLARFEGVRVFVPSAAILATEVFDLFLDDNNLRDFAIREHDDREIERRFLAARFPEWVYAALQRYLLLADYPLAVRSSSLLEDSQHLSFTGVFQTYMVANTDPDPKVRVRELLDAIKRIYASTFSQRAKDYIRPTPFRLDQEKMAVILQRLVGARHGGAGGEGGGEGARFYPDFAGVARSHNFYPAPPMNAADGIVSVALGLGETVVGGGQAVRFSPKYPRHGGAYSAASEVLRNAQTDFYALALGGPARAGGAVPALRRFGIDAAVADGTFTAVGSVYSPENDAVYDGAGREGVPVVTFAPVLKHGLFPLAEITSHLLDVCKLALNAPVEIEFAANLSGGVAATREFAVLQVRPFAARAEAEPVTIGPLADAELLCRSELALGNGTIGGVFDLVVVDRDRFDRARSVEAAADVGRLNARLAAAQIPYVLIGVGRWGAADPWLGIPVTWEQISGARAIVEANFKDFDVAPSQGSHFFQNLAASLTGYLTVGADRARGFVDWEWLAAKPAIAETGFVRHLRFAQPVEVRMDGRAGRAVIVKPGGTG